MVAWAAASLMGSLVAQTLPDGADGPHSASAANCATIILKRRPPLFGTDRVHYVIDRGPGVVWDATVQERSPFPEEAGNFCDAGNVIYLATARREVRVGRNTESNGQALIIGVNLRTDLQPNSSLVGRFDPHGTLTWTRPPGRMRLEVVNVNGNQSVGPPLVVEAGKTYEITIRYGERTVFEVRLLPDSRLPRII